MFQSFDGKKSCNIKAQGVYEWQRKFPTGVKFLYFRSEELTWSGRTHNAWSKQKEWNPAALLSAAPSGSGQGLWKAEGNQADCKCKKHMLRCDIKSKYLDLMRYSLLCSFPGIGGFPDKGLGELLLCPSMNIFIYGKTHNSSFSHPHHCMVLGVFWVRGHCWVHFVYLKVRWLISWGLCLLSCSW